MKSIRTKTRIGIIYLAIGIYDEFWNEFYPSCEKFFCPDAHKGYEVFTDSKRLVELDIDNVTFHPIENKGFIRNVSAKSECICRISEKLKQEYDYVFFLNANFKYVGSIYTHEVIPTEKNNFLTALSFSFYRNRNCNELPYDRNPDCLAYIPYGKGTRYYQGGLYGGRTQEIIQMSEWIKIRIGTDLSKKIIAKWHDESYVNRYLLDKNPLILDETYAFAEEGMKFVPHKMIVLDKKRYLGKKLDTFKDLSIDNSLAFLLDDQWKPRRIVIVHAQGRLGNQMFQFAFLLYLRKKFGKEADVYFSSEGCKQLMECFPLLIQYQLPLWMVEKVKEANPQQIDCIKENNISKVEDLKIPSRYITHYIGYWQCWQYAEEVKDEIKEAFSWEKPDLQTEEWRVRMNSNCSVSIHIRRGDYLSSINKDIFGRVCTLDYYKRAMQEIIRITDKEPIFYLFSDDPQWVKEHFKENNCIIMETSNKDWQDMYFMASCKHHILSNSSFSWWGAWLGEQAGTNTIAPQWWYYGVESPHLLPDGWIRIPIENPPTYKDSLKTRFLLEQQPGNGGYYERSLGMCGKMGQVIALYNLYKETKEERWKEVAEEWLDEIIEGCDNKIPINYGSGLCGIGVGIEWLIQNHYVEGDADTILAEFDWKILIAINDRNMNQTSIYRGILGIAYYIYCRLCYRKDVETSVTLTLKEYSIYLLDWLEEILLDEEREKDYNEFYFILTLFHRLNIYNAKVIRLLEWCDRKITK